MKQKIKLRHEEGTRPLTTQTKTSKIEKLRGLGT